MASLPALPVVIGTALVDAINPCAIGVLVLLATTLLGLTHDRKRMLWIGSIYVGSVFLTYLAAGFGLLLFIQRLGVSRPLGWAVGSLIIIMGIIEIKDFFWYGKGISLAIPAQYSRKIQQWVKHVSVPGAILLGMFVAAVELPCTGGPYLAIMTVLATIGINWQVVAMLVLYNIIFVLPLIAILLIVYFGGSVERIAKWRTEGRGWMRLAIGLVMVGLGVALILWVQGIIGFG